MASHVTLRVGALVCVWSQMPRDGRDGGGGYGGRGRGGGHRGGGGYGGGARNDTSTGRETQPQGVTEVRGIAMKV